MKKFIKTTSEYTVVCNYCSPKDKIFGENIYNHIKTKRHENNTPENEMDKLTILKEEIHQKKTKRLPKNEMILEDDLKQKDTKNYLTFIAFAASQGLSFSQISKIGRFLRSLAKEDKLNFLRTNYFDEEVISNVISECFRPTLLEKLYQDLQNYPFSLSLDTTTIGPENICALRIRYSRGKKKFSFNDFKRKALLLINIIYIYS